MAKTLILQSLPFLLFLLLSIHAQTAVSWQDEDEGDIDYYVLDSVPNNASNVGGGRMSRFLTTSTVKKLKKGTSCNAKTNPKVCNGVWADKGTTLLYCCKKHCRNVLGDRNNCGGCGRKCGFGERCCGGACINVLRSRSNCGKCGRKCAKGVKCEYGYCGYA